LSVKIPDPLMRRHLIEREQPPAQALRLAEAYLEQDRALEAIEFLHKAGAEDRLVEIRRGAVESGDVFLLRELARLTGAEPERGEWRELAEAAGAAGKERYAAEARRQAERGEE
jgi:hypothetical protein